MLIRLKDISKTYMMGKVPITALNSVSLDISAGDFVCLTGPSGSGKSTMLHIMGCIENPTSGEVLINGEQVKDMRETRLARFRNRHIGFIFQSFNLISVLNVFENIEYPLMIRGGKTDKNRVNEVIEAVGLSDYMKHRPDELSGGQRQRVAIARALVADPDIIIADEPTANLDSKTGNKIIDLLIRLNEKSNTTFLFSTHNESLATCAKKNIHLLDGEIVSALRKT